MTLGGPRNQTREWDSKVSYVPKQMYPALSGVQLWREPNALPAADAGPSLEPASTPTSATMALSAATDLFFPGPWVSQSSYPVGVIMS